MVSHKSVLLQEVLHYLNPQPNKIYLDCTFGAGGYTKAILSQANCKVIALDRDETTSQFATEIKKQYGERFEWYNIKFSEMDQLNLKFDGIVMDLGVSSMQIDDAERGFSFQNDAKLNMSMGQNSITAYDLVNNAGEGNLADIIYNYGDEVKARHIAREIVKNRPIETTMQLAQIVNKFYPIRSKISPATKTFQAIRIAVNDEIGELETGLNLAKEILYPKGRLVVVSFHSLEDGVTKKFMLSLVTNSKYNKYKPKEVGEFNILTKKPVIPSEQEVNENVRSRSAKLRCIEKI
ncbi:MAG: 16S rRNA (cytosine(1402)-N(4))-methyltransferase RsmH [Rickettsiales bacterium]|jgi:16S rRNA (cytosine1402-N4)-methyltransferase|nr:16S rRNA (cytosine(1402)-N(4))-methyltransferase RsmH [Rickettsiales bacterium]